MAKENLAGKTEAHMMETIYLARSMGMADLSSFLETITKVIGLTANRTGEEFSIIRIQTN